MQFSLVYFLERIQRCCQKSTCFFFKIFEVLYIDTVHLSDHVSYVWTPVCSKQCGGVSQARLGWKLFGPSKILPQNTKDQGFVERQGGWDGMGKCKNLLSVLGTATKNHFEHHRDASKS